MPLTRRDMLKVGSGMAAVNCCALPAAAQTARSPVPDAQVTVLTQDAVIGPDSRSVQIPVRLSIAAVHTLVVQYTTETENVAPDFAITPAGGQLIFHPGEQTKLIELSLSRELGRGQSIALKISDFGYPLRHYPRPVSRVTTGDQAIRPPLRSDNVPLPALPTNGKVVFADDLRQPDFASDTGFRADGSPCWQSRLARTRQQTGNKEIGYYADPALNPEARVWGIDPATGNRFIQAEHHPSGLSDGRGGQLTMAWQPGTPFRYSAAMVTSRTLFNRITIGSYVEFEVKLTRVAGSWPALWLLSAGDNWPPEIDVVEAFLSSPNHPPDVITSSIHWRAATGNKAYGASMPLSHAAADADIFARFNRFGCLLAGQQIVYYFNDRPYCAMPNLVGAGPWYMLMDVAVGGLVKPPEDPTTFPAPMHVAGVKVVQFS